MRTVTQRKVQFYSGEGRELIVDKVRPDDFCPCGSGKKVKYCCGMETIYYKRNK